MSITALAQGQGRLVCWTLALLAGVTQSGPPSPDPPGRPPVLPDRPFERTLSAADSAKVEALQQRIASMRRQARAADAIELAEEVLQIRRRAQGADHWETADAARLLATLRHVAALPDSLQAQLAEADRADEEVVRLFSQGDLEAASSLIRRQLGVRSQVLGPQHPEVASTLDDLAFVLFTKGDMAAAEPLFRSSLILSREALGPNHPLVARAMNNMATVLTWQGAHEAALEYSSLALAMNERLLGPLHPHVVIALDNHSVLLGLTGAHAQAVEASREAVSRARMVFGDPSDDLAHCTQNLAYHLSHAGELETAESLLREALAMVLELHGEQAPQVADARFLLARGLVRSGKFAEARDLFQQALGFFQEQRGAHPDVAILRFCVAEVLQLQGEYAAASQVWGEARAAFDHLSPQVATRGLQRLKFTQTWAPHFHFAACLARLGHAASAWEQLEAGCARGLLEEVRARTEVQLTAAQRAALDSLESLLVSLDEAHAALTRRADPEALARRDSLRLEQERARAHLAQLQAALAPLTRGLPRTTVALQELQSRLAPDEAVLTWVDIEGHPQAADPSGEHWACVVRGTGDPMWVRLQGSGAGGRWLEADHRLPDEVWRRLAASPSGSLDGLGEAVRALVHQRAAPLQDPLRGVHHLIAVPSGSMARIPLEVAIDSVAVTYVPSATFWAHVAGEPRAAPPGVSFVGVGDPVVHPESQVAAPRPQQDDTEPVSSEPLAPLPGSRREVEAIAELFTRSGADSSVLVLLGPNASEESLCALARSGQLGRARFLHFATHALVDETDPLGSGLVLSVQELSVAARRALTGEEVHDGVLTARQILATWNLNADLVVLSACETGLGKEYRGEGLLGLAQAFFVAGARCVMVSLWKVEDCATMLLMTRFYENILGLFPRARGVAGRTFQPHEPMPKALALEEAKRWLRNLTVGDLQAMGMETPSLASRGLVPVEVQAPSPMDAHPFAHPHFWAAFILVGDTR